MVQQKVLSCEQIASLTDISQSQDNTNQAQGDTNQAQDWILDFLDYEK